MKIEFWFEFASTYSYLSALRLPGAAAKMGIEITWNPFLLGPIFAAQGWDTSPFNIYAAKGNYMWRDMERRAEKLGLTVKRPDPFPQHSVLAARVATAAEPGPEQVAFCHNIFLAQFAEELDISDPDVVTACAGAAGLPEDVFERATSDVVKTELRATTEDAMRRGIFGAPCFFVGHEHFWGDDRLEDALEWAVKHG